MSPEDRAKNTVNYGIAHSEKSSIPADRGNSTHSRLSDIAQYDTCTHINKKIPKRYVLARKPHLRFGRRVFKEPLQNYIWCLVLDPATRRYEFELLSTCQEKENAGQFVYDDVDRGKGIHPYADLEWMSRLWWRGRWSKEVYDIEQIICVEVGKWKESTVLLSPKAVEKELLNEIRREYDYVCDDLVRLSLSEFDSKLRKNPYYLMNDSRNDLPSRRQVD